MQFNIGESLLTLCKDSGIYGLITSNPKCLIMIAIACVLLYLAIVKKFEPLLLMPIAFGMLLSNLPFAGMYHEAIKLVARILGHIIGGGLVQNNRLDILVADGLFLIAKHLEFLKASEQLLCGKMISKLSEATFKGVLARMLAKHQIVCHDANRLGR